MKTRTRIPSRPAAVAALAATLALAAAAPPDVLAKPKAQSSRAAARTAGPKVQEHVLANGLKVLLVPRHISPTVTCGWVAHVGSVNERPGITGLSHLFEHMMFKGTHVIGTRDYALDERLIAEQEVVQDSIRAELSRLRDMQRRGLVEDMTKPESKTAKMRALEARFDSLVAAQRANMIKNEYDKILSEAGAVGTNAFTAEDMTVYFTTLPANKLELWFWMESDRIKNRVFREFYSERDVVYEERRRSVESTPTGKFQESFESSFWDASPYSWPVLGWPSDVASITKAQADDYYSLFYAPQNLTAVLVGDFDAKQGLALAQRYLGSIPHGARPAPEMITMEPRQPAEKRFFGEAEVNPGVTIRWHTPAFRHVDTPAIEVLIGLLNGPTGRLQRNLVLGNGPATSASANQDNRKYEGLVEVEGDCKDGRTPEELEKALLGEVDKLRAETVSAEELQKVKNRYLTATYRALGSNQAIMFRYAVNDGYGDWHEADRFDAAVQAVTAADVRRVANTYFTKENRAVAIWTRKTSASSSAASSEDGALAALPPPARAMAKQAIERLGTVTEPEKIQAMLAQMDQMSGQAPAEMKPAFDLIRQRAQARLDELSKKK